MADTVIEVENLSKKYIIGHQRENAARYESLRDVMANGVKSFWRSLSGRQSDSFQPKEEFWALKDVSFEVKQGEVIGIIGRNGAGKSTLLKILSRITEPTTGRIKIKGRVASLLEVGTGFHPELTGRENIYLNGSILGMSRAEIQAKFDEIVDFAEVEKFLDTPVKFYSSGMYVRLAFAVAAHLEPEILVVDEVLAVGDAAFQKKCLGKMGDVATKEGRTVLFVSHNMTAVKSLCTKAIWVHQGATINIQESLENAISAYLRSYQEQTKVTSKLWLELSNAPGNEYVKVRSFRIINKNNEIVQNIDINTEFMIEFEFFFFLEEALFYIGCHFQTLSGENVFVSASSPQIIKKGLFRSIVYMPSNLLNNNHYIGHVYWVKDGNLVLYKNDDLVSFEVQDIERENGAWMGEYLGGVRPKLNWSINSI